MSVKFELVDGGQVPLRATPDAAGYDLCARLSGPTWVILHSVKLIPLGIKVAIPPGHLGLLALRSSMVKRGLMLANGVGIIDPDYRGEIGAMLYSYIANTPVTNGERIAQLIIVKRPAQVWVKEKLDGTARGEGGFGSTGV